MQADPLQLAPSSDTKSATLNPMRFWAGKSTEVTQHVAKTRWPSPSTVSHASDASAQIRITVSSKGDKGLVGSYARPQHFNYFHGMSRPNRALLKLAVFFPVCSRRQTPSQVCGNLAPMQYAHRVRIEAPKAKAATPELLPEKPAKLLLPCLGVKQSKL